LPVGVERFRERGRSGTTVHRLLKDFRFPFGPELLGPAAFFENDATAFSYADSPDGAAEMPEWRVWPFDEFDGHGKAS
jgi:hypothetical protein